MKQFRNPEIEPKFTTEDRLFLLQERFPSARHEHIDGNTQELSARQGRTNSPRISKYRSRLASHNIHVSVHPEKILKTCIPGITSQIPCYMLYALRTWRERRHINMIFHCFIVE